MRVFCVICVNAFVHGPIKERLIFYGGVNSYWCHVKKQVVSDTPIRFGDIRRSFTCVSYYVKNSKVFQLRIFLVTVILNLSVKGGKTYLMLQCFFKES
jgi:hypothetical protein